MFTKSFAVELAPHKICVNAVAPGLFGTPGAQPRLQDPKKVDNWAVLVPLKKVGEAADIIGPVVFLHQIYRILSLDRQFLWMEEGPYSDCLAKGVA